MNGKKENRKISSPHQNKHCPNIPSSPKQPHLSNKSPTSSAIIKDASARQTSSPQRSQPPPKNQADYRKYLFATCNKHPCFKFALDNFFHSSSAGGPSAPFALYELRPVLSPACQLAGSESVRHGSAHLLTELLVAEKEARKSVV